MANGMLGYGNLIDQALVQDGFWLDSLPLANVQDVYGGLPARTPNLDLSSTQFTIDVGAFEIVRAIAIPGHNLTRDAGYRIKSSPVSDFSIPGVDTGWSEWLKPVYPFGTLPWGAPNWWDQKYSEKELAAWRPPLIHVLDEDSTDEFWRIELDDQGNPDGYFEMGRPFIGPVWQPQTNFSFGASLAWEDPSQIDTSLSGREYADERPGFRVARFSTDWMEEDEALARAFEIQRASGVTREVLFIWNPEDTVHFLRRSFIGRLRKLDPITNPYVQLNKTSWEAKERL